MKGSHDYEPVIKIRQEKQWKYRDLDDFRAWLEAQKLSQSSITQSLRGITEYRKTGMPLEFESLKAWREQLKQESKMSPDVIRQITNGAKRYLTYLTGNKYRFQNLFENRKGKDICDDDCFNCRFPDCIKPDYLCIGHDDTKD